MDRTLLITIMVTIITPTLMAMTLMEVELEVMISIAPIIVDLFVVNSSSLP